MERKDVAELVEWIDIRWGKVEAWETAGQFAADFADVDKEAVWEALLQYTDNPDHKWPPRPRELRALALERMRHKPKPALPETTERYSLAEWLRRNQPGKTIGEVIEETARAQVERTLI